MNHTSYDASAIDDNSTCRVQVEGRELLLVRSAGELFLYENRCPHTQETLDPMGGALLDDAGSLITCQRHAAQFLAHSGECVAGPCLGESLTPVAFTLADGQLYLD